VRLDNNRPLGWQGFLGNYDPLDVLDREIHALLKKKFGEQLVFKTAIGRSVRHREGNAHSETIFADRFALAGWAPIFGVYAVTGRRPRFRWRSMSRSCRTVLFSRRCLAIAVAVDAVAVPALLARHAWTQAAGAPCRDRRRAGRCRRSEVAGEKSRATIAAYLHLTDEAWGSA